MYSRLKNVVYISPYNSCIKGEEFPLLINLQLTANLGEKKWNNKDIKIKTSVVSPKLLFSLSFRSVWEKKGQYLFWPCEYIVCDTFYMSHQNNFGGEVIVVYLILLVFPPSHQDKSDFLKKHFELNRYSYYIHFNRQISSVFPINYYLSFWFPYSILISNNKYGIGLNYIEILFSCLYQ